MGCVCTVVDMHVQRGGLGDHLVAYHDAWREQRSIHAEVAAGARPPTLLMVEHSSVYTAGRRTSNAERAEAGVDLVEVDRGGRITWHGPGQLVVYPIVRLREPVDVVTYVRHLEDAVIATAAAYDITGHRVAGRSGVWVRAADGPDRKLAAIGVRVAKGTTMHGLALNVCPDLSHFDRIVPCGISDAETTSLVRETGRALTVSAVADVLTEQLRRALAPLLAPVPLETSAH